MENIKEEISIICEWWTAFKLSHEESPSEPLTDNVVVLEGLGNAEYGSRCVTVADLNNLCKIFGDVL